MLDYSTCVIGDKFGSISVIRLPKDTNEDTQVKITSKKELLKKLQSKLITVHNSLKTLDDRKHETYVECPN